MSLPKRSAYFGKLQQNWGSKMSTRTTLLYFNSLVGKIFGTAMIPVVLFLALIAGHMLPSVHRLLISSKKEGLRNMVDGIHAQFTYLAEEAKGNVHLSHRWVCDHRIP